MENKNTFSDIFLAVHFSEKKGENYLGDLNRILANECTPLEAPEDKR